MTPMPRSFANWLAFDSSRDRWSRARDTRRRSSSTVVNPEREPARVHLVDQAIDGLGQAALDVTVEPGKHRCDL